MKPIYSFALVLLMSMFSVNAHAQKCDLDVDEVDAFTKEHVKAGTNAVGGIFYHWKLTLSKKGKQYGWDMQIKWGKHLPEPMRKGDIIYCKLDNNEVVQLVLDNDYAPTQVVQGSQIVTTFLPKGSLDEASMKKMSDSPLAGMRVVLSGETIEPSITSKQGEKIQNIAKCVMQP